MTAFPTAATAPLSPNPSTMVGPLRGTASAEVELPALGAPSVRIAAGPSARTEAAVRVLLVEELDEVAERVRDALRADGDVSLVEVVHDGAAALERIAASDPDVVVIDALLQGRISGLQLAQALRAVGRTTPVLFLTVPNRPLKLNEQTGLAEVLTLPIDGPRMLAAIHRLDLAHRGPVVKPPTGTIAVFSAKGGVGRTAIAHNLAVAMRGVAGTRVVLVDGDQVHGDLRLHLEAPESAPSLVQLPTGHVTAEDVTPLLWQDATGLDVLLAPPRMEQADLIMLADVRRAHHTLRQMVDLVVVDVPAVMDDRTLALLDDADVVLDVTTPRHGAVRKTQRCHAVLAAAAFPMHKLLTVVNHADADYDPAEFAAELGWQPDAVLMHDERLASGSIAAGSSILTAYPDSLFSQGFNELAGLLATRLADTPARPSLRAA